MSKFPGWTRENLDFGVEYLALAANKCAVVPHHPVARLVNEARAIAGRQGLSERGGAFLVDRGEMERALEALRRVLGECVVCTEEGELVALLPCGHVCCCGGCVARMRGAGGGGLKCPLCRETVADQGDPLAQASRLHFM